MFKKSFLSVACFTALLAVAGTAAASTFHLVVPLNARTPAPGPGTEAPPPVPEPEIAVSLAGAALPKATLKTAYSESLRPYLSVTGDAGFDPAEARWSLAGGALPAGLALDNVTGQVAGTPSALIESTASFDVAVTYKGKSAQRTYTLPVVKQPTGCNAYLQANPGAPSGWYTFDPDGEGPGVSQSYYCDMTSDGGGWTRIVRQTEAEPVTNWNGGVNGQSYALATAQIPSHTQTAFGRDDEATFLDYFNYQYTTGAIGKTTIFGLKANKNYHIARVFTYIYPAADPDRQAYTDCGTSPAIDKGKYCGFLTVDRTGGTFYDWAFFPNLATVAARGYALKGSLASAANPEAWTVWVR